MEDSKEVKIFEKDEFGKVRVFYKGGELWFVAKDVAEILGYVTDRGMGQLLSHVPTEWKSSTPNPNWGADMLILSEPGLYFFLARSDKPKALPFQKWIAGEVLPSIRKTGSYTIDQELPKLSTFEILHEITGGPVTHDKQLKVHDEALDIINNAVHSVKQKIKSLEANNHARTDYLTIAEYCSLHGITIHVGESIILGKKASRMCREHLKVKHAPDSGTYTRIQRSYLIFYLKNIKI